jgi:hypothetical protein
MVVLNWRAQNTASRSVDTSHKIVFVVAPAAKLFALPKPVAIGWRTRRRLKSGRLLLEEMREEHHPAFLEQDEMRVIFIPTAAHKRAHFFLFALGQSRIAFHVPAANG